MSRSNLTELIAEVETSFSKYADVGLLDKASMRRAAIKALRRLGNDVAELHETVLHVKNGKCKVPANFRSMYAAWLCEPLGYTTTPGVEEHMLMSSHFYTERVTHGTKWNECNGCCHEKSENIVRENLYFKKDKTAEFYYKNPTLLRLGKTFHKSACHKQCRNKLVRDNVNEIIIIENTLQANFSEGDIYMTYYGIPMDESGNLTFPDTKNGSVADYLEFAIKEVVAEDLIGNGDAAAGISNLYQVYVSKHKMYKKEASNELKMGKINPSTFRRWKRLNQIESFQYESSLTNKNGSLLTTGKPVRR